MTKETDQQIIADIKVKRDQQRQQHAKGAQQKGSRQPPQLLPPPTAPMAVARQFVESCCLYNGAPMH